MQNEEHHTLRYIENDVSLFLSERHEESQLIKFYNTIHNESPLYLCQLVPPSVGNNVGNVNLCIKNKLDTLCIRTVKYQKCFLPNVLNLWTNVNEKT